MGILRTVLLATATLAACSGPPPTGDPGRFPVAADNVVVFLVDTLRRDHLGTYGYPLPTSPVLDGLAREGAVFDRAYSTSPWTYPSVASLVTGLYPEAHAAFVEGEVRFLLRDPVPNTLAADYTTLAEILEGHGVRTALFANNNYLGFGIEQGFSKYHNEDWNAEGQTAFVLRWLDELPEDERFFLIVHFMDVHEPNAPPARHRAEFEHARSVPPDRLQWFGHWQTFYSKSNATTRPRFAEYRDTRIALYDASIRYVDEQIGRIVDHVAQRRPEQRTALIATADHGEEFWDHAELEQRSYSFPSNNYGVSHGHTLFEELVRIPLILHWKGQIPAGRHDFLVSLVDVLPTVLDLMDVPHDGPGQGRSLVSGLLGEPIRGRPLLFSQPCLGREKQGVIVDQLKLIESDAEPLLLFDLAVDPGERTNLAAGQPAELLGVRRALATLIAESRALGETIRGGREAVKAPPLDPEQQRRMRALGYVR